MSKPKRSDLAAVICEVLGHIETIELVQPDLLDTLNDMDEQETEDVRLDALDNAAVAIMILRKIKFEKIDLDAVWQ